VLISRTPSPLALSRTPTDGAALAEDPVLAGVLGSGDGTQHTTSSTTKYTIDRLLQDSEAAAAAAALAVTPQSQPSLRTKRRSTPPAVSEEEDVEAQITALRALVDASNAAAAAVVSAAQHPFFVRAPRRQQPEARPAWEDQLCAGFWPVGDTALAARWLFAVAVAHSDAALSSHAATMLAANIGRLRPPPAAADFVAALEALGGGEKGGADQEAAKDAATAPVLHNACAIVALLWVVLQQAACWDRRLFSHLVGLACDPLFAAPSTPQASLAADTLRRCIDAIAKAAAEAHLAPSLVAEIVGCGQSLDYAAARVGAVPPLCGAARALRVEAAWEIIQRATGMPRSQFSFDALTAPGVLQRCATAAEAQHPGDRVAAVRQLVMVLRCVQICVIESGVLAGGDGASASENAHKLSLALYALSTSCKLARADQVKEETLLLTTLLSNLPCGFDDPDSPLRPKQKKKQTTLTSFAVRT